MVIDHGFKPYYIASIRTEKDCRLYSPDIDVSINQIFEEGIFYSNNRGTFSIIRINDTEAYIEPDFLGTRIIYYYQGSGIRDVCIVSNDIRKMIHAFNEFNLPVEIDYIALGTTYAFGNLQTYKIPIKNVKMLAVGNAVYINNGRCSITEIKTYTDLLTKETLRIRAAEEILDNIVGISLSDSCRFILEMTGGVDSRVTFSALIVVPPFLTARMSRGLCCL